MTLAPGKKLGPYEIVAAIGAGGMGEVWRAKDTRLDRDVAVKVLPEGLARNEQLRARFEREAKSISALNHPHICTLHDVGHQDDVHFLVMELLDGETLAQRLEKGPLPAEQVLRYGAQTADALHHAHKAGIVHRDLKPSNLVLTKNGAKLLDFGLARMASEAEPIQGLTSYPTQTKPLTQQGTILGTFQYMAPEQLEGLEADARTDIFALGAVLHEMATGRRAFEGKSKTSLIAAIVSSQPPPISSIQPMSPPALDHVVRRCLEKDPDDRWQTAHDVKLQLQWIAEGGSQVGLPAPVTARRRGRERWAWLFAALFAVLSAVLGTGYWMRAVPEVRSIRSSILSPEGTSFDLFLLKSGGLSLSPDGRFMTFSVRAPDGGDALWIRSLDSPAARPLAGTQGATWPFWSPDSRFIAFFADGKLKKIDLAGSPGVALCDAYDGRSGSWSQEGVILFAPTPTSPIHRVPAAGGKATPVTQFDEGRGETTHRWASFLPDGRHFLYMAGSHTAGIKSEANAVYLAELGSDRKKLLLHARSNAIYASGHLLYVRDRVLLAQPFDPRRLEFTGDPVPIGEGIDYDSGLFRAIFSASENGVLAYRAGGADSRAQLEWLDRSGKGIGMVGEAGDYDNLALSPDGRRLGFNLVDPDAGTANIWIQDLARGVRTRLTFGATSEISPVWSPDGERIAYAVTGKHDDLLVKPSVGGKEAVLLRSEQDKLPTAWYRDGRLLVYSATDPKRKRQWDIWILPLSGKGEPRPYLETQFNETGGQLSPDGRWMLYLSDESGRNEVYVAPFPEPGGKWQISTGGAVVGKWLRGGTEIIYLSSDLTVMTVEVLAEGSRFETGSPKRLFRAEPSVSGDITPDGQRFIIAIRPSVGQNLPITLVANWTAGLDR